MIFAKGYFDHNIFRDLLNDTELYYNQTDLAVHNNISEDTLSQELKEKLNDFKANLESDDFKAY